MADFEALSEDELVALCKDEIKGSIGYSDSDLSNEREKIMRYYHGELPKRQSNGNSSYVSQDVYDGVEGLKASKGMRAEKALMTQRATGKLREVTEDFNEKLSKEILTRFQTANDDVRVAEEDIKKYLKVVDIVFEKIGNILKNKKKLNKIKSRKYNY